MKKYIRLITLLGLLFGATTASWTQNNSTQSPYTRFGLGEISRGLTNASKGMGGLSLGIRDASLINPANPASYTAVDSMTFIFDLGLSTSWSLLQEGKSSASTLLGNIDYATLLFPINKYIALSAGITPFSTVGYRYTVQQPILNAPESSTFKSSFYGTGNLNEIYAGISIQPFDFWSIGVNGTLLFGSLRHNRKVTFPSMSNSEEPAFLHTLKMKGWGLTAGTQFQVPLREQQDKLTLGLTFSPGTPINSTRIELERIERAGQPPRLIKGDTLHSKNLYHRPESYGLGLSYALDTRLLLGADVLYNRWNNSFQNTESEYKGVNQFQVALGAALTPNVRSGRYAARVQYRLGLNAENSAISVRNAKGGFDPYYKAGVTVGVGLPLVDRRSYVDLLLSYSRVIPTGMIKLSDNVLQLTLSLRFNEAWFKQIKLD